MQDLIVVWNVPMNFVPFLAASLAVQVHILASLLVLALTPFQFWLIRKGSALHRAVGYVWVTAMAVVALSSFAIPVRFNVLPFGLSPIHGLSVLMLGSIAMAIVFARRGAIGAHRRTLGWAAVGFVAAGLFTFLPSRIMGQIVFG
jgi:uncharacterized membrane protein